MMSTLLMKPTGVGVCLLVTALIVPAARGIDEPGEAAANVMVVIGSQTDAEAGGAPTFAISEDGQGGTVVLRKVVAAEGDDATGTGLVLGGGPQIVKLVSEGAPHDPSRGWLGVTLDEVNPVLAAQLGLDDAGAVVLNVADGSPAEDAGVERYDVILAIDGETFGKSVEALAKRIGEAGAGGTVALTIIRAGQPRTLNVTLASRPEGKGLAWLYRHGLPPAITERLSTRGMFMGLDEDGNLVLEDLEDLTDLEDLPDVIRGMIPRLDDITTQVWVDADEATATQHITVQVDRDGESLEIEQQDGGEIVVRRATVRDDGIEESTEQVYPSAEELEAADPEAYELYARIGKHQAIDLHGVVPGQQGVFQLKLRDLLDQREERVKVDVEASIERAREAFEKARQALEAGKGAGGFGVPAPRFAWKSAEAEVTHSFDVDADGRIEIRLRKGDSEVIMRYDGVDDLERRNPELYVKFADVIASAVEE